MSFIEGFFDDTNIKNYKLWSSKYDPVILEEPVLASDLYGKRSKNAHELAERCFVLTPFHLYYKKKQSDTKLRGVMDLTFARTEFIENLDGDTDPDFQFSIKFIKNLKFTEIYTNNKKTFNSWKKLLSRLTIQTNFHTKFNVIKMIGKGSFARVYLIESNELKKKYAVKAFSKEYLKSQKNGKESLVNEIQIMQSINHKNVIELIEVHESQNSLYVVMELLEGGEIFSLNNGKLDTESTYIILEHILEALVAMAEQGIMHRDLKPDNIIFKFKDVPAPQNLLKLVDFGLATFSSVDEYLFKRCGTPGFVAPEVINAKKGVNVKYTPKCDVFSVGITFFFMLTGKIPYDGQDFEEVLANNKKAIIDFGIKELKNIPPSAIDLLKKMLGLEPVDRWTAAQCLKHEYFSKRQTNFENIDEGVNLSENLLEFKNKYLGQNSKLDSIRFNANPDFNGKLDTMKSSDKGSQLSMSSKIQSFSSNKNQQQGVSSPFKDPKFRPSIYKYALMKGNNNIDMEKELEKMGNASMDSYDSKNESISDNGSPVKPGEGSPLKVDDPIQLGGAKSRFSRR